MISPAKTSSNARSLFSLLVSQRRLRRKRVLKATREAMVEVVVAVVEAVAVVFALAVVVVLPPPTLLCP